MSFEELTKEIEEAGYTWDIGYGHPRYFEARIWDWPYPVGRCTVEDSSDIYGTLKKAWDDVNRNN